MQPRDYVLDQLRHHATRPVPYSLSFEDGVAEALDAHYGGPAWRARLTPYLARIASVDTMQLRPTDDTYGRDVFGGLWRMNRRPWHLEKPPLSQPSLAGYAFPKPEQFLLPDLAERAQQGRAEHPDSFTILGLGWGLFEHAWLLRGFENALMDAAAEPDFYAEVLDRLTELFLTLVRACAAIPADAILFGDDWGEQRGVILGPERWRRFLKPRWASIYQAVHAQGKLCITHSCGSVAAIVPDLIEIGLDVLESVQPEAAGMNPYELKRQWGDKITFWGCLGSQSTIQFGTPLQIHAEVQRLCREMGQGGGYILAPAKALQPGTPPANAVAVFEAFTAQEVV
jgi:uroporphyrinogen decarboxylase